MAMDETRGDEQRESFFLAQQAQYLAGLPLHQQAQLGLTPGCGPEG